MEKKRILTLVGGILAVLVGILRAVGAMTLVAAPASAMHLCVGIGLLVVALWLIIAGVAYLIRRDERCRLWLTIGLVLFWIDGIVNGFLLFGSPQFSGQIINLGCTVGIAACLWVNPAGKNHQ